MVNIGLYEDELQRLDEWAASKGLGRGRAVAAMTDIVTGATETREQRFARERGLIARVSEASILSPPVMPTFGEARSAVRPLAPGERVTIREEDE